MDVDRERFRGFADLYAAVRPRPPQKVVDIVLGVLGQSDVDQVVDLGSGTGLSTAIWRDVTRSLVGIEPTTDMRNQAQADFPSLRFLDGSSYVTGLPDDSTDVVTCSQSFHWMEPRSTLREAHRILKVGGVFVVYDCLWPVTWDWRSELQYKRLLQKAQDLASGGSTPGEGFRQYPKEGHGANIEGSGYFAYTNSFSFDSVEDCDADRFVGIALSQGLVQSVVKRDPSLLEPELEALKTAAKLARSTTMRVSYVLHYGVKAGTLSESRRAASCDSS